MLKIKSLVFGYFIVVIWIFSYSGGYGADWKYLQTNFQWEFSYDAENITHSSGNISPPQVWLPPEWKAIPPDTAMDTLYKELCK